MRDVQNRGPLGVPSARFDLETTPRLKNIHNINCPERERINAFASRAAALAEALPIPTCEMEGTVAENEALLTTQQAADVLLLAPSSLQRMRTEGTGPTYVKVGKRRVGYRHADLTKWIDDRVAHSTSDARIRGLSGL